MRHIWLEKQYLRINGVSKINFRKEVEYMKEYVKPEIAVKEYRVSKDIAALKEYYYESGSGESKMNVSLFALDSNPVNE